MLSTKLSTEGRNQLSPKKFLHCTQVKRSLQEEISEIINTPSPWYKCTINAGVSVVKQKRLGTDLPKTLSVQKPDLRAPIF